MADPSPTIFAPWARAEEPPPSLPLLPASAVFAPAGKGGPASASSHAPVSIRRLSIMSGVVHRRIRGVGFVLDLSSGAGLVGRVTNVKNLDVLHAMKCIGAAQREAAGGEDAAGAEAPPLAVCLAGFAAFADLIYKPVIPLPLGATAWPNLYHDAGVCAVTGRCWKAGCEQFEGGAGSKGVEGEGAGSTGRKGVGPEGGGGGGGA